MQKTERFEMRVSEDFALVIDQWRRIQPRIPTRSDAIRRLVSRGLADEVHLAAITDMLNLFRELSGRGIMTDEDRAKVTAITRSVRDARAGIWDSDDDDRGIDPASVLLDTTPPNRNK